LFTYPLPDPILNFTDILVRAEKIVGASVLTRTTLWDFPLTAAQASAVPAARLRNLFINGGFTVLWDVGMGVEEKIFLAVSDQLSAIRAAAACACRLRPRRRRSSSASAERICGGRKATYAEGEQQAGEHDEQDHEEHEARDRHQRALLLGGDAGGRGGVHGRDEVVGADADQQDGEADEEARMAQ
jgi:hypothetical protein